MSDLQKKKVFAICGSTRKDSVNLHILQHIVRSYPAFEWELFTGLDTLPHFNPDLDNELLPGAVAVFRKKIEQADGVLICTPEYVFSLPGSLKNALEWTVSTIVFSDKPVIGMLASSQGQKGFEALQLLMGTLVGASVASTSLLIPAPKTKVTAGGMISDEKTLADIDRVMKIFTHSLMP